MRRHVLVTLLTLLALVPTLNAAHARQSKKLKVYISADMEGVSGVSTWKVQAQSKEREFEKFARLMTQEVNAAIAGDFGVPVVFLSGDQTTGEEAKRLLGPIETVAVKQAVGFHAATMLHPEEAQRRPRAFTLAGARDRPHSALGRRLPVPEIIVNFP